MSADKPRVVSPNRAQLLLQPTDRERCIPDEHAARGVWRFVESLDLFRTEHGKKLDALLTQTLGSLMKHGVVKLRRVAQDGMKVRASAGAASFIVGADVTNHGNDQPHVAPMLDEIERRTGKVPAEYLVDGGFAGLENIEGVSQRGATVYAPTPKPRNDTMP